MASRVYSTIHILRNMGLKGVLDSEGDGYSLAADVLVIDERSEE